MLKHSTSKQQTFCKIGQLRQRTASKSRTLLSIWKLLSFSKFVITALKLSYKVSVLYALESEEEYNQMQYII